MRTLSRKMQLHKLDQNHLNPRHLNPTSVRTRLNLFLPSLFAFVATLAEGPSALTFRSDQSGSHILPFSHQRSKACRWAAVMREFFVRGGDFQELGFREWSAAEFHTDRQLGRRRTDEPASARVRRTRRPVIHYARKPRRDDDGAEAA